MVFSSLLFLFRFLPVVLILYFISPKILRNGILFIVSLIFYAWGEPVYITIMLFSTLVDYIHGILIDKAKSSGKIKRAKILVASSVIINLSLLCFFKYTDFFINTFNNITGLAVPLLNLPLPIGISFYTFQTMSYSIDIYRGKAKLQKNIINFGTYVTLFPQLIAGPIVQYNTIADQLTNRQETFDKFSYGIQRFITGLGKKVLLANNIGLIWTEISSQDIINLPVLTAWIGITAFAFQIYFDFSGYSDMAIGLGSMFGFRFLENFNYPYMSRSITEFWRRWHISLSSWFRDYLYIPLGGNRKGLIRQIFNIIIVWAATGIWHGAGFNFLFWGLYFGFILILEKSFLLNLLNKLPKIIRHIYTILIVWVGWVIFAFDNFNNGIIYLKAMFGLNHAGILDNGSIYYLYTNIILLIVLIIGCTDIPKKCFNRISTVILAKQQVLQTILQCVFIIVIFTVCTAYLVDSSYNPFLYFRF